MDIFDLDIMRKLEEMNLEASKSISVFLIKNSKTKPDRKAALIRDLEKSLNSREISRIMWNVLLAGEGLSITDSKWQEFFGGAKK